MPLAPKLSTIPRRNSWVPLNAAAYPPNAEGAALRPVSPAEKAPLLPAEYLLTKAAKPPCTRCVTGRRANVTGVITVRDALSACKHKSWHIQTIAHSTTYCLM